MQIMPSPESLWERMVTGPSRQSSLGRKMWRRARKRPAPRYLASLLDHDLPINRAIFIKNSTDVVTVKKNKKTQNKRCPICLAALSSSFRSCNLNREVVGLLQKKQFADQPRFRLVTGTLVHAFFGQNGNGAARA